MPGKKTIWFVSEVYHPDEQGTAFYTTGLAEGLSKDFDVRVLCSFPTVTARGAQVPQTEVRNGVAVERCMGTTFDKDKLLLRFVNIFTCSAAILLKGIAKVRKGDLVIAVTAPPSMPFVAKIICLLVRAKCTLRLEDVYPEIMVATGLIRQNSPMDRVIGVLNRMLYKSADRIVVLGRDMHSLVERKIGGGSKRLSIIRCWSDTDIVWPVPKENDVLLKELGLNDKFIVSCIGNIGRAQAIEVMLDAATLLKDHNKVHFLFIGSGARKVWMEREIGRRKLTNVSILGQRPRSDQLNFLNACDISIISLLPGIAGAAVPSRLYNIMAAGKPVVSVTGMDSEVSRIVREEDIGWVVPPDKPQDLAAAIVDAFSDPERIKKMGTRAYTAARLKYPRERVIEAYRSLFDDIWKAIQPASHPEMDRQRRCINSEQ
jgi:glycosyltransferase involved in cell wall biosynthesis